MLWRDVTRSVAPLHGPRTEETGARQETIAGSTIAPPSATSAPAPSAPQPIRLPSAAALSLGRRLKQRVARGKETLDGKLDLHGLTQAEAHGALLRFLSQAQARGAKLVVVITGKGSRSGGEGVLRRQVPLWLRLREFSPLVIGFEEAHRAHGGEGALYIRVRRARG